MGWTSRTAKRSTRWVSLRLRAAKLRVWISILEPASLRPLKYHDLPRPRGLLLNGAQAGRGGGGEDR